MSTRFEKADRMAQELAERMHRPAPRVTTAMLGKMLDLHPASAARAARAYGFKPERRRHLGKNRGWCLTWSIEEAEAIKARREAEGLAEPEMS